MSNAQASASDDLRLDAAMLPNESIVRADPSVFDEADRVGRAPMLSL